MNELAIRQKIQRLRRGDPPRVLDLFSGCGGMSLGFFSAGYQIAAAIEQDHHAALSHALNFHGGCKLHGKARDITTTSPKDFASELQLRDIATAFDVLIGGPPCQAFARVGRSKLREVAEHPEAFRHDPRSRLYIEYLNYVEECAPLAVVIENVPDMLNHGGHNLAAEIAEILTGRGYVCRYSLLNAAFFGVPQMRERMILVAIRRELTQKIDFPTPTHWVDLPSGYLGSRSVALKLVRSSSDASAERHYVAAAEASETLPPTPTAEDAISDLPPINARELLAEGRLRRGTQKMDLPVLYGAAREVSRYAVQMRTWPGFEGSHAIYDHVIRYLPRDYRLFAGLKAGDQYPEAHRHALKVFEAELNLLSGQNRRPPDGSPAWNSLRASIVPPYDPKKFPNKWRKMEPNKPARTLLAHLGKDGYSHIHYDSLQARTISVREAARLQSFPDGFRFSGTMNSAFRQIGNAVPPLLSRAIAHALREQLLGTQVRQTDCGERRS